jgi:hypothetical protein
MNALWKRAFALLVFAPLLASGCADPYAGRHAVSGMVKLKGEPIKEGVIIFEPLEKQDTQTGAPIKNGDFSIDRKQGLKVGKYRVRVTAGDGVTPAYRFGGKGEPQEEEAGAPGGSKNIVSKDLIPASWNANSKQEVTVEASKANHFEFNILAK